MSCHWPNGQRLHDYTATRSHGESSPAVTASAAAAGTPLSLLEESVQSPPEAGALAAPAALPVVAMPAAATTCASAAARKAASSAGSGAIAKRVAG